MAERKYLRVTDISFKVAWRPHGSELPYEEAKGTDIGEGGLLLVVTDRPLTLRQVLELRIDIPPTPVDKSPVPIHALAEPVWVRPTSTEPPRYDQGLSFTRIAQADFSRLENYILLTKWMRGEQPELTES
jgi:hypothetical protein